MPKPHTKICLIILGGTVLVEEEPEKNAVITEKDVKPWMKKMPEINLLADVEPYFILGEKEKEPKMEHWIEAAKIINSKLSKYDGFVITHHPYSLIFAANALSFMISGIGKPVVFTGSQIPLPSPDEPFDPEIFKRYKGLGIKANLINALQTAVQGPNEISIIFGSKVVRASQAIQEKGLNVDLFDAPIKAIIGTIDFGIRISEFYQPISKKSFKFNPKFDQAVYTIHLFPSINPDLVKKIWLKNPSGLIIQGYNPTMSWPQVKKILAPQKDIPIVIHTTLPFFGQEEKPFIVVHNMTSETTLIKLMWILGQTKDQKQIRKMLKADLAGEIIEEEKIR